MIILDVVLFIGLVFASWEFWKCIEKRENLKAALLVAAMWVSIVGATILNLRYFS